MHFISTVSERYAFRALGTSAHVVMIGMHGSRNTCPRGRECAITRTRRAERDSCVSSFTRAATPAPGADVAGIWHFLAATLKSSRLKVITMNGLTEEEAVDYLQRRGLWTEARADSLRAVARQACRESMRSLYVK